MEALTYRAKVRKDGSFVISKMAREALGLKQGDEIAISVFFPPLKPTLELPTNTKNSNRTEQNEPSLRMEAYLAKAVEQGEIASATAISSRKALEDIQKSLPSLPLPDVSIVENAQVMYTWDKAEHHLLLEVFPDKSAELFYGNRLTSEVWGYDYRTGKSLSSSIVDRITTIFQEK